MTDGDKPKSGQVPSSAGAADWLQPFRSRLQEAGEQDRYRLLATLMGELADLAKGSGSGRSGDGAAAGDAAKRLKALGEEKASVEDALAQARADLKHQAKQFEAERERAGELQRIADEQRTRLSALQKKAEEVEADLIARNNELHRAKVEIENLRVALQRAELKADDGTRVTALEKDRNRLGSEIEALKVQVQQVRSEKDLEIERLKSQHSSVEAAHGRSDSDLLKGLWDRLARSKPAMVEGHVVPIPQAAERLVDAFIELAAFAYSFEQHMTPFLDKYTKHNDVVKRPWQAYRSYEALDQTIRQTIAVHGSKPVGVLRMRLDGLKNWTIAALIGGDSAVESTASELHDFLRGKLGMGDDPNRKIKEFIKEADGHERFRDHMVKWRSDKLADAYAMGGRR